MGLFGHIGLQVDAYGWCEPVYVAVLGCAGGIVGSVSCLISELGTVVTLYQYVLVFFGLV